MKESVFKCTPKRRNVSKQFHRDPVLWWDIDSDKYIRLRKTAFKKWQYHPNILSWINYKKQVSLRKSYIRIKRGIVLRNLQLKSAGRLRYISGTQ